MEDLMNRRLEGVKRYLEDEANLGGHPEVFPFSIGDVKDTLGGKAIIANLELDDCELIVIGSKKALKRHKIIKVQLEEFLILFSNDRNITYFRHYLRET